MPPPRRRPVPTTPTTRPRVAGLRKRPDQPSGRPDTEAGHPTPADAPATPAPVEPDTAVTGADAGATDRATDGADAAGTRVDTTPETDVTGTDVAGTDVADTAVADTAGARSTEVTGLIEPRDTPEPEDEPDDPAPRPRPTGRRRRTGEAVAPSVLDDPAPERAGTEQPDTEDADPEHADPGTTPHARPGLVLPLSLLVLAALLVGLGAWFQHRAGQVHYNQALVDSAGTTEVAGQAREAVEKAFSYNYADVSATEKAANELLVGKARCQYNAIFGPVRTLAPEQKLVVTVKAVSSGVTSLDGDQATVLLFLDQVTTRTTDNQSGGGIAMMRVGAQRVDGRWKVQNMEMFGQTGDQAAETAKC
ncbi:hypothetical protein ACIGNX_08210 [Actinosynnema sp. NPDC053489]|uniref:hypothetical protein n=1 Tax=Actinosynnema sp. NPDC053489 TaxID=3363916 RepID=UPI0037CA5DF6